MNIYSFHTCMMNGVLLGYISISQYSTCLEAHKPSLDEGKAATLNTHCIPSHRKEKYQLRENTSSSVMLT